MNSSFGALVALSFALLGVVSCQPRHACDQGCSHTNQIATTDKLFPADPKGHLFIIGGGDRPDSLLQRYLGLAGEEARVVVLPFASGYPDETGEYQASEFKRLGAKESIYLYCSKDSLDSPERLAAIESANAIFFSGGDQERLANYLRGTKMLDKVRDLYARGGVVGGTSAGAAVMSQICITGKEKLVSPVIPEDSLRQHVYIKHKQMFVVEGFGFLRSVIIDQHFNMRKRLNRLISVMLDYPPLKGIGIDEATAIIVYPDATFEVAGHSSVFVIEHTTDCPTITVDKNGYQGVRDMKISLLLAGERGEL